MNRRPLPRRPNREPGEEDAVVYDASVPGRFRTGYVVVAILVVISLLIGLLGPIVWRMI